MRNPAPKLTLLDLLVLCLLLGGGVVPGALHAASVGVGGYTNSFATQPPAADWAHFSIAGAAADATTAAQITTEVQAIAASSITTQTLLDAVNPPALNASATWCSTGFYLQTRPTGNRVTLLMCTLVNNLGGDANSVTISYDFAIVAPNGDEISGHNTYYSLTGAAGSWTPIPALSFASASGRLSANLSIIWPGGSPLYILWADDNSVNSPDTANQIANFSAIATPATQTPAAITSDPQSQTVGELQPVSFTVGVSGNPLPTVQWYSNTVAIPGATSTSYSIAAAPLSHHGLNFRVIAQNTVTNVTYSATSGVATLSVNADTVSPVLLGALPAGLLQVVASFSERLALASVTNVGNYSITGLAGNLIISNAVLDASQTNLILSVSAMTPGTLYTLTVNGVTDPSAAANRVATNSQAQFTAVTITSVDIGNPNPPGQVTLLSAGANITAAGSDIGGTADQFTFSYQTIPGDFDIKVRVQGLLPSDVWAKAGLMARENVTAGSRYAASFATPGMSGCFLQHRTVVSGASASVGSFPVAYPGTWLRLKRVGNVFTGYAGLDGDGWSQLGSVTIAMPGSVLVGFAVTGRGAQTTAQFRDYDTVASVSTAPVVLSREPLGPSSRKTGLSITEIMYHPRSVPGATNANGTPRSLEFIEIYNSNPFFEHLGNYRLSGSIDYTFAPGTTIPGGGFLVVARDPAFVQSHYGISGVLGPWAGTNLAGMSTNNLPGGSGTVRLRNPGDAVMLEVNYRGGAPYPVAADGAGHSLALARASYGEGDPRAWAISQAIDGSPGRDDAFGADTLRNVVINEFLAHTDDPLVDYIELYNHATTPVDISGAYLADEADFIQNPSVTNHFYRFPNGTSIPARGFLSVNQTTLGFSLSASGERIYLVNSNQTRVIDSLAYEPQQNGVSMGRSPDGASAWYRMASRTPGLPNSGARNDSIVINEIMYSPITGQSDDEYVELYNRSGAPVNVGNWRFVDGIDYHIPANTTIAAGGYLVIARSLTNLLAKYPSLNTNNTRGDYSGNLGNGGERIALAMPDTNVTQIATNPVPVYSTNTIYVTVNEVAYADGGRWGFWSDGGGSSLELRDPRGDNRQPANWADSDESAKGIWTTIEGTNAISETLGSPINDVLLLFQLGIGECLVDDVEVRNGGGANSIINPGFETGTQGANSAGVDLGGWIAQGSHDHSTFENTGFTGSRSLHLRTAARGDNGANRVRSAPLSPVASGSVVLRARVKWVRGWPELLLRLRGGGLEVGGRMLMQPNLGTPGLPNSRLVGNAGPAVYEVAHNPILPAVNEPVIITARVTDPDAAVTLRLKYRVDPSATYTTVTMLDDGLSGDAIASDGIYTATISGRAANTVVPFYLEATDGLGAVNTFPTDVFPIAPMTRVFPLDATTRECVIRWGDALMPGSFSTYHVWLTSGNTARWRDRRPVLCNAPVDGTFVYNNYRVIYNLRPQFAGSPWHRGSQNQGPDGGNRCDYDIEFPEDDRFLGSTDAVWNNPGNPGGTSTSDTSAQSEQTTYLIFRELRIHFNYRRYMHVYFNGNQRSTTSNRPGNFIFEDSQQPSGEIAGEWFPDDTEGQLFKIEDWFEFPDNGDDFTANNDADLSRRIITGTTNINIAPYRFMFRNRARGPGELANDYTNFVNLLNIVSPASNPTGATITNLVQFDAIADYEQWMRIFACQHAVGNWDSYGYNRGKNAYMFKPKNGKFDQWTWDIDFTMGIGGDGAGTAVFGTTDSRIVAMWDTPAIRRAYFRAFEDIVNGPMNRSFMDPIIDAKAAALAASAVNYDPALINTIKTFVTDRRNYLLNTVLGSTVANFFTASVNGVSNLTTNNSFVIISGTAPVGAKYIYINGAAVPVTWTSISNWNIRVALDAGVNTLNVQGYTLYGAPTNAVRTITVNYTGAAPDPVGSVIFNELLYQPALPDSSFVEVFNVSTTNAFNIGGWRINGLDFEFPNGVVIAPRQYLVVAKSIPAFAFSFGFAITPIGEFGGNLDPDGETLTLIKPATNSFPEVVVDRLRYENQAPWPVVESGSDISLQLIDAQQDNSRVSNWGVNRSLWSYVTYTGLIQSNGTSFLIYMPLAGGGDVYIDDLVLVTNTTPELGPNLLLNGDFEAPLSGTWTSLGNHGNSVASTAVAHSGSSSLHVVATGSGGASAAIRQIIAGFATNTVCTVSFWFMPATNGTALTMRTTPGSGFNPPSPYFNIQPRLTPNSPGTANQFVAARPPYDPIWLNEIQAENPSGITDNLGDRDPWIELYNAGTSPIDMSGYYLANNYGSNLTQWQFPAGYTLAPGEFRVVWADGESGETSGTNAHTSLRAPVGNGTFALTRLVSGQPQITDYLTYANLRSGLSYGDFPDGQPISRRVFQTATGGGTNNSKDINVFINEWMAANFTFIADPSDGQYDDWFELYNAGDTAVDLGGYYLTDNPGQPAKYHIPNNTNYVIPPGGYLLVWADNDSADNSIGSPDLHVNFSLDADPGEALGLYAPDGVTAIDTVTFGRQTNNISEGRYADGATNRYFMATPTPRSANVIPGGNTPPVLNSIADRTIRLGQSVSFTASATDAEAPPQTLNFSLGGTVPLGAFMNAAGQFLWTPSAAQTPSTNTFTVFVTDNGGGALSDSDQFIVTVLPPPVAVISGNGGTSVTIGFDTIPGRSYRLYYKVNIGDAGWLPLSAPVLATGASLTIEDVIGDTQRFYRIGQVD